MRANDATDNSPPAVAAAVSTSVSGKSIYEDQKRVEEYVEAERRRKEGGGSEQIREKKIENIWRGDIHVCNNNNSNFIGHNNS